MKKILIIGTVPYNDRSSSRAFEAYFHGYSKDRLAQIFSNPKTPVSGHCAQLFQITDQRMLQRWLRRDVQTGKVWLDEALPREWVDASPEVDNALIAALYRLGSRKSALNHLLRGLLWRKKYWCTPKLLDWMDEFSPECVFLAFSDDFFIPQIALFTARRYDIPIVSCIGDDYYFNDRFSVSPFYHLYRSAYKKLIRQVFHHGGSAIYISDKIKQKYYNAFGLDGQTVYLTSTLSRREFLQRTEAPGFYYFGNIGLGRYRSLYEIALAMQRVWPKSILYIYSDQHLPEAERLFARCANIRLCEAVPYSRLETLVKDGDIFVIAEGFRPKDINATRYSLSTKAADALASGCRIFVYGPEDAGVVEYMRSTKAAAVCTRESMLDTSLRTLFDEKLQQQYYCQARQVTCKNHNLQSSTAIFRKVIADAVDRYERKKI